MTAMFFACQSENIDCMYDRQASSPSISLGRVADRLLLLVDPGDVGRIKLRADLHVADGVVGEGGRVGLPHRDGVLHQLRMAGWK